MATSIEKFSADMFPQTEVIVIPIIDVSGSMSGEKIGKVNEAMAEVPEQLAEINNSTLDSKLRIAPMEFSTGARWFDLKNDEPADVEAFRWIDMKASGLTDMGAAFALLNEKLTVREKGGWMEGRGGYAPILILISDGAPTDDYESELAVLKRRGWFRAAVKFAVAVGSDANREVLAKFTGNDEAIIDTETIRLDLASIIKSIIVTASKTVSQTVSSTSKKALIDKVTDDGPEANEEMQGQAISDVKQDIQNKVTMDSTDDLFGED